MRLRHVQQRGNVGLPQVASSRLRARRSVQQRERNGSQYDRVHLLVLHTAVRKVDVRLSAPAAPGGARRCGRG